MDRAAGEHQNIEIWSDKNGDCIRETTHTSMARSHGTKDLREKE